MCIRLIAASGALVLGLLVCGNAPAQEPGAASPPPARTPDADMQARIAKARALTASPDQQDYLAGFALWKTLADQGVPEAQMNMGESYHYGHFGLCRDDAKAIEWYSKAADQGGVEANRRIAEIYASKESPVYDPVKAVSWYQKAADLDDIASQAALSNLYRDGEGVPKDPAKSIFWLEKAARHPNGAIYAFFLGNRYSQGTDVPRDDDKAAYWYLIAAKRGQMDAMTRLGAYYERHGKFLEAYKWYALVVEMDKLDLNHQPPGLYQQDVNARNRVAARLAKADLAEARAWVKRVHITRPNLGPPPVIYPRLSGKYCDASATPRQ